MVEATCAMCGEKKELCGSPRIEGVPEPRVCKECLVAYLRGKELKVNPIWWLRQLSDYLDYLGKRLEEEEGGGS